MAELCVSGCVLSDSAVKNPEGEEGLGDAAQGDEHSGRENGQYLSFPVQSPDARSAALFVRKKTFSCTSNYVLSQSNKLPQQRKQNGY